MYAASATTKITSPPWRPCSHPFPVAAGDVRGQRDDEDHESAVEAVQPPVPGLLEVADGEHLNRAEEGERERPGDVPPLSPPAAQRHQEHEHLRRMDHGAADDLVRAQRAALAETPRRR